MVIISLRECVCLFLRPLFGGIVNTGIDHNEYVVEAIVNHRGNPRKRRHMEFLVRWKGYEQGDHTWESYATVKDLAALDEYSAAHPELRVG